jgi:uncharacterized protein (DUF4415 family)
MKENKKSISSDLKKVDILNDETIDYSALASLDDSFFQRAIVKLPQKKDSVTLRIDHEVLQFF